MPVRYSQPAGEPVVVPFRPSMLPEALRRIASPDVLERWQLPDRSPHGAHLVAISDASGEGWAAAALVTARPQTAYVKIVDALGDVATVVAAVVRRARDLGCVSVKWEGWTTDPGDAATAGFTPLRAPLESSGGAVQPSVGYIRWLSEGTVDEPPYYRQSTTFSCGAVAALTAQVQAGALEATSLDRTSELTLWRDATNFLACEPVGLGVAIRRRWASSPIAVFLDTDLPVMLDSYPESEQEWRAVLQRASRKDAAALGVPVRKHRLAMPEIRTALRGGDQVLLVISLAGMQRIDAPHWVLCHGVVPGAIVLEDSWINDAAGETWVDAHLIPVREAALETMSAMAEGYRGAVVIGKTGKAPHLQP